MANYTFSQLEQLWTGAGGPSLVAPIAAAIALAESSGNPKAINPTDNGGTQTSWGLWQISNGTHGMPVPNILDPHVNAQQAVAKYRGAGNSFAPWGTYATGAYTKYLPGGAAAAAGAGSTSSGGSSSGTQQAVLTGFNPGEVVGSIADPFKIFQSIAGDLFGPITGGVGIAQSLEKLTHDFTDVVSLLDHFAKALEWLIVPSHWVRIIAFAFGTGTLLAGSWALMKTGQGQGDITLALGIFLVTAAGVLLFIAFHNLPATVTDLGSLLGWISRSVSQGQQAAQ